MYPLFEKVLSLLFISVFFIYVNAHLIINRIAHLAQKLKHAEVR